jgi:riboflavin synthase
MFTGIVERVAPVSDIAVIENGRRITVEASEGYLADVAIGDSIAVDGVCLTVVELKAAAFSVDVIGTTMGRTTLARTRTGSLVNLERALPLGGRLGGHLVQGHVDGTGVIEAIERAGEHVLLRVQMPPAVAEVTVLHGSIAIHGVSLTVNALPGGDVAETALIPHTWMNTNLQHLAAGDEVNLEGDMLGRFVVSYLRRTAAAGSSGEK